MIEPSKISLFLVLFFINFDFTRASLICPPCDKIYCFPRRASNLKCPAGIAKGVCGCCPVCAQSYGQKCGGDYNYLGSCDKGLTCVTKPLNGLPNIKNEGTCEKNRVEKKVPEVKNLILQADQPKVLVCKPKCTVELCSKNPKAICSARDIVEENKHCQGECQHTTCRACRLVQLKEPICPKCETDNFSCMRKFGKCIRKWSCNDYFPCSHKKISEAAILTGTFQCLVPDCA